jgi:ketosteroid isomerase-like protein
MKKTLVFLLSLCLISTVSAQVGKSIKGNGKEKTENRAVGPYDGIALSGWFTVELTNGDEGDLTLMGDENLLEHLETVVKNGTLHIRTEKGYSLKSGSWSSDKIVITVPVKSINEIALSGSGSITSHTTLEADFLNTSMSGSGDIALKIATEKLKISLSGSGDVNLSGSTNQLEIHVSGSGDVRAYELAANSVETVISGSADIQVTANESLVARVSGSGDVHYRGNPSKIDSKTSGSGDVTAD